MSVLRVELSDDQLDVLADRVAERVTAAQLGRSSGASHDRWMTSREAAEYVGLPSVDQLHKLTAARAVPFHRHAERGRLYFKRSELDDWRLGT